MFWQQRALHTAQQAARELGRTAKSLQLLALLYYDLNVGVSERGDNAPDEDLADAIEKLATELVATINEE